MKNNTNIIGKQYEGRMFKDTHKNIIGRQYGYRSSALRAIRNFRVRFFATIPKGFQFWVNRIDDGCHEIEGMSR